MQEMRLCSLNNLGGYLALLASWRFSILLNRMPRSVVLYVVRYWSHLSHSRWGLPMSKLVNSIALFPIESQSRGLRAGIISQPIYAAFFLTPRPQRRCPPRVEQEPSQ